MGQEISQQRTTCKNYGRKQFSVNPVQNSGNQQYCDYLQQASTPISEKTDSYHEKFAKFSRIKKINGHTNYLKHKEPIYTSSSISNSSSTDDEDYKQYQKYNLTKQSYEKSRISKQHQAIESGFGRKSLEDSSSSSSDYHSYLIEGKVPPKPLYQRTEIKNKHQRNISSHSTTTDSGIYYSSGSSSTHTTPIEGYSLSNLSVHSGRASALDSHKSRKSLAKQKEYLEHHLYIKSYLDILEEDEIARSQYKVAKPGGIRNYTPKILADICLSSSAPVRHEDPWIWQLPPNNKVGVQQQYGPLNSNLTARHAALTGHRPELLPLSANRSRDQSSRTSNSKCL